MGQNGQMQYRCLTWTSMPDSCLPLPLQNRKLAARKLLHHEITQPASKSRMEHTSRRLLAAFSAAPNTATSASARHAQGWLYAARPIMTPCMDAPSTLCCSAAAACWQLSRPPLRLNSRCGKSRFRANTHSYLHAVEPQLGKLHWKMNIGLYDYHILKTCWELHLLCWQSSNALKHNYV